MGLGSWTRRTGFWALDALRGRPVRHHYDDIRATMAGERSPDEQLGRLLEHASRTSRFYGPYAGQELAGFPVIDRAFCRQHIGELRSSAFTDGQLRAVSTSGSTGTPLTIQQDRPKRQRAVADLIHFHQVAGLALGEQLMWIHEWNAATRKSRLGELLQNVVPVKQATLDARGEDAVIARLARGRIRGLLAYGSELWSLARRIEEHHPDVGRDFGLSVVLSHADDLSPDTRARIRAAFGAPVVDRYSNSENGILACTRPDDPTFQLNRASFRFELLALDFGRAPGAWRAGPRRPHGPVELRHAPHPLRHGRPGHRRGGWTGRTGHHPQPGGPSVEPGHGQPGPARVAGHGDLHHERLPRPAGVAVHPGAPRSLSPARDARGCEARPRPADHRAGGRPGADARISVETVERIPRRANQKYQAIVVADVPGTSASPGVLATTST